MEEERVSERVKKRREKRGEGTGYLYLHFALSQSKKRESASKRERWTWQRNPFILLVKGKKKRALKRKKSIGQASSTWSVC